MAQNDTAANVGAADVDARGNPMTPTVVVGIGGTGLSVLYRVRRRIIDTYGSLDRLPVLRFLWVDCDPTEEPRLRRKLGIPDDLQLQENEKVEAVVEDARTLYAGIEAGNFPHYAEWFAHDQLKTNTNVGEGAGRIRQLARLAFFYHHSTIGSRLISQASAANASESRSYILNNYQEPTGPGVNVVLACSVAGGTGSGMFLDMAYTCRQLYAQAQLPVPTAVTGVLVLPVGDNEKRRHYANTYAALKELNYFSYHPGGTPKQLRFLFGDPVFRAQYAPGAEPIEISESPFDYTYVIDGSNTQGKKVDYDRVMDMVADYLCLDFATVFATKKRALRVDVTKPLGHSTDGADCPKRFLSFGTSTQLFPAAQAKDALAHRLAADVARTWSRQLGTFTTQVRDDGQQATCEQWPEDTVMASRSYILSRMLPHLRLGQQNDGTGGIIEQIGGSGAEQLVNLPGHWEQQILARISNERWATDSTWVAQLDQARRTEDANYDTSGDSEMQWGARITRIVKNQSRAVRYLGRQVRQLISEIVSDGSRGPDWALCLLEQFGLRLQKDAEDLQRQARDAGFIAEQLGEVVLVSECRADGAGAALSNLIEAKRNGYLDGLRKAAAQIWPIGKRDRMTELSKKYLHWAALYQRAKVLEMLRGIGARALTMVLNTCDSIRQDVSETRAELESLQRKLSSQAEQAAERAATMPVAGNLIYGPALADALYDRLVAQNPNADAEMITKRVREKIKADWLDLPAAIRKDPELPDKIIASITDECWRVVDPDGDATLSAVDVAAYDHLCAMYKNDNDLQNQLADSWAQAAPFVALKDVTLDGGWSAGGDIHEQMLIGVEGGYLADDPDPERARVNSALLSLSGVEAANIHETALPERLVFVRELGGFPLRAVRRVDAWRKDYRELTKGQQEPPLHCWKDEVAASLPDIFPPTRIEDVITGIEIGHALGVLRPVKTVASDGRELEQLGYEYTLPSGFTNVRVLGVDINAARVRLCEDETLIPELLSEIHAVVEAADETEKARIATKLREVLAARLEDAGGNVNIPAYQGILSAADAFAVKHGLDLRG